jgi:hypothetical protein
MINEAFMAKENELKGKYLNEIIGISNHNKVDMNVAFLMLLRNPINLDEGFPVYEGAEIDYEELRKDIAELDSLRRK